MDVRDRDSCPWLVVAVFTKEQELALQRREQALTAREAKVVEVERRYALHLAQQPASVATSSLSCGSGVA